MSFLPDAEPEQVTAADFPAVIEITTRWHDNDIYGHVNNVDYYAFFDTAINTWLITEGDLDIHSGGVIGLCAESHCNFLEAVSFPETIGVGIAIDRIGTSSVRYSLAIFAREHTIALGWFVHVFVDRRSRRPQPIPPTLRKSLERLRTSPRSD